MSNKEFIGWSSAYVAIFTIVNLIVYYCGAWVIPITTSICVAANMMLRDRVFCGRGLKFSAAIAAAAGLCTFAFNHAALTVAIASFTAVVSGAFVAGSVFKLLKNKVAIEKARPIANTCSAITDSLIYPTIAFMTFLPFVSMEMFASKFLSVLFYTFIINKFFNFDYKKGANHGPQK